MLDPDEPVKLPGRPGDNVTLVLHTPEGSYTGGVTLTKIPETRNLLLGVVCKSFYMGKENPFPFNPAELIIDAVCIDEEKWGDRDWHIIAAFPDDADDGESDEGEPDEAEPDRELDLATMAVAGNA